MEEWCVYNTDQLWTATRGGATVTLYYDQAGRKTQMVDADMGTWRYTYHATGSLKTQLDDRGCTISMGLRPAQPPDRQDLQRLRQHNQRDLYL